MVRSGSTLTFYASGRTGGTVYRPDVGALRSSVIASLARHFTVRDVTLRTEGVLPLLNYEYEATIVLTTRDDYGHADDVGSVVANAFYVASGALPVVSSDWHDGPFGGTQDDGPSIFDPLNEAKDAILGLPKLVVVGLIIIVAIVAFSPLGKSGVHVSAV